MINEAMGNLIELIKTVPEFSGRVGSAVGGTDIDPTMSQVPLPLAWVTFDGDQAQDANQAGQIMQQMKLNFYVEVAFPNKGEVDFLTVQVPFLESVVASVRGQDGPIGALKWKYEGQVLGTMESDYIGYTQFYSILAHYK